MCLQAPSSASSGRAPPSACVQWNSNSALWYVSTLKHKQSLKQPSLEIKLLRCEGCL